MEIVKAKIVKANGEQHDFRFSTDEKDIFPMQSLINTGGGRTRT